MPEALSQPVRVAVIGAGHVGATFAYALMFLGIAAEIVLIDANRPRAEGEAMDLNHTEPFTRPTRIWAGDYSDCASAAIVCVTAGAGQKPGETRLDLARKNAAVIRSVIKELRRHAPSGLLLIATNPVDVLTHIAATESGFDPRRVIGSGTILDTARFRHLIGRHFDVDPHSVHAFILGEHGDSEVPLWSLANIGGVRVADFARLNGLDWNEGIRRQIYEQTRDAAYHIIERKGATYYAVGAGLARICQAVLRDQRTVLTVSSLARDFHGIGDVCLSLPTIVSRNGIERVLQLEPDDQELQALRASAAKLKAAIQQVAGQPT